MAALAVLLHAIPAFTERSWKDEGVARFSLGAFAAGVALLLYGFLGHRSMLFPAGAVVLGALLAYLGCALVTLAGKGNGERVQRAVARAFSGTLLFLLVTALFGFSLTWVLGGSAAPFWIAQLPSAHAALGTLGWLSLLIFGVSMRTFRPITGTATRWRLLHIVVGSLAALGVILLALGAALPIALLARIGGALFALGALVYVVDAADILRRATAPHRAPQAFIGAALCWFIVALVLGAGVLLGQPWGRPYVFVLLAGWIGQMVNAHLYHIGIRVIATLYRGDDDETRPEQLLESRLSWYSFFAVQAAIAIVLAALFSGSAGLAARGAVFGAGGWIAMVANVLIARARAGKPARAH